jgi:chromosome segregation ATPase
MDKILDTATQAVTGNFTLTATLPQGKSINFSGYMYSGESIESVNQRLDLLSEAMERQRLRAEIPELEMKREHYISQFKAMKGHMQSLVDKQNDGKNLTSKEKLDLKNMQDNVVKAQEEIDKGQTVIDEQKRKAGLV